MSISNDADIEHSTEQNETNDSLKEIKVINSSIKVTNGTPKDLDLIWSNVSYSVQSRNRFKFWQKKEKLLLNNVSGRIKSGQLTAIMGPSGSGKTTLIECLAGRRRIGVTGDIIVNGTNEKVRLAYMAQNESLMLHLTVEETLLFSSKLKNNQKNRLIDENENIYIVTETKGPNSTYHQNLVRNLIDNLGLENCANVKVGQCSGGQQKRLSIALELISSPSILMLDEPTSGLDAVSSLQCISLLRKLCRNPIAIAASIHQPTALILSYFDNLYILSLEGHCIYSGPSNQLIEYLNSFDLFCPKYHNPADYITEIASGGHGTHIIDKLSEVQRKTVFSDCFNEQSVKITKIVRKSRQQKKSREMSKTWILFKRCLIMSFRDPTDYLLRAFSSLGILALISLLYISEDIGKVDGCATQDPSQIIDLVQNIDQVVLSDPKKSAMLNLGFIFCAIIFTSFTALMPTILTFPLEVRVFIKEYFNGWYSIGSYFVAKNMVNLLPNILFPIIFGACSYLITAQVFQFWRFSYYVSIVVIIALLADSLGFIIAASFVRNINASVFVGAVSQIPMLLFTGLLVRIPSLPAFIRPFTYLSYFRLGFETIVLTIYGFDRCAPTTKLTLNHLKQSFGPEIIPMMGCLYDSGVLPNITQKFEQFSDNYYNNNPSIVLTAFGITEDQFYIDLIVMIVYGIVIRGLAYFVLSYRANSKK